MGSPLERQDETAAGDELAAALTPNGHCARCGAPVAWVKTVRGRNLPLDPEPSDSPLEGNFAIGHGGVAHYVRDSARMRAFNAEGTHSEFPIYVAHFASCAGER